MANQGVNCNVSECAHYVTGSKCQLSTIEVTNEQTGAANALSTPHFCKSFTRK